MTEDQKAVRGSERGEQDVLARLDQKRTNGGTHTRGQSARKRRDAIALKSDVLAPRSGSLENDGLWGCKPWQSPTKNDAGKSLKKKKDE